MALSHALAISLGPDVRVNCVSPGWIATSDTRLKRKDHTQHPAGRVGRPQDVAEMVAFLLDGEKSGFVTGANVVVDGGMGGRAPPAQRTGGAYCNPPLVHSAFRPRAILRFEPCPTFFSKISP